MGRAKGPELLAAAGQGDLARLQALLPVAGEST